MHNAFLLIDIAPNRKKLELKIVTFCQIVPLIFKFVDLKSGQPNSSFYFEIVTFCHIVPLIFKFVYLKSGQPNSNFSFENRHFLSHRPPNFLDHFLEISAKVPEPPEKFV